MVGVVLFVESTTMSDVTRILSAIDQGDPAAAKQLLPLVYEELRRLAAQKISREKPGQTLQPTTGGYSMTVGAARLAASKLCN
jgi:hypothetical protein